MSNPHGFMFGPDDNGDGVGDMYVASQANASVVCYDGVTGDLIRVLVLPGSGDLLAAASVLFLPDPCPWDLDGSGSVGTSDLLELFAQWGTAGSADFDESGAVGTSDLLILFANWGPCP